MKASIIILAIVLTGCATQRDSQIMGAAIGAVIGSAVGTKLAHDHKYHDVNYGYNPYLVCDRYWHRQDRNRCIQDIRASRGR